MPDKSPNNRRIFRLSRYGQIIEEKSYELNTKSQSNDDEQFFLLPSLHGHKSHIASHWK